eukprot:TRINITY_DN1687_c0_g1_i5.p1 TRINITY_DN1687_c0_g1~~TRINITY_DN1687_c0_g1_i5.p1  ORF type:complete len:613 (-),score=117.97 TRINITY_DN1687_c0_g1_i5:821-2659(-)
MSHSNDYCESFSNVLSSLRSCILLVDSRIRDELETCVTNLQKLINQTLQERDDLLIRLATLEENKKENTTHDKPLQPLQTFLNFIEQNNDTKSRPLSIVQRKGSAEIPIKHPDSSPFNPLNTLKWGFSLLERKLKTRSLVLLEDILQNQKQEIHLSDLLSMIPKLKVKANTNPQNLCATITGPDDFELETRFCDYASAWTVSTYPELQKGLRIGDPICDRYSIQLYENMTTFVIADGCSWGTRPRKAATIATTEVMSYLSSQLTTPELDSHQLAIILLKAFVLAHTKILQAEEIPIEAGTTTLLVGVVVQVRQYSDTDSVTPSLGLGQASYQPTGPGPARGPGPGSGGGSPSTSGPGSVTRWGLFCASVGDCKAFVFSQSRKRFVDVTSGNRGGSLTDCGGRLGPSTVEGHPDLRNLRLDFCFVEEGDIVVAATDGIYDNMDPVMLGLQPEQFGLQGKMDGGSVSSTSESWELLEKEKPALIRKIKAHFLVDMLNQLVAAKSKSLSSLTVSSRAAFDLLSRSPKSCELRQDSEDCKEEDDNDESQLSFDDSAHFITKSLIQHVLNTTHKTRRFMESHPNSPQPPNGGCGVFKTQNKTQTENWTEITQSFQGS